jgi:hypothetical protein
MSKLRNQLLTAAGFSILVFALLLASPPAGNAVPSDKDVRVINTTLEPVPTAAQGTTNIAGSVSVANTPTVLLAAGASVGINPASNTVHIGNTAASAVPVVNINDAGQPFQNATNSVQSGTNVSVATIATVPAGKRLVIEFVSMTGQVPPGQHVELLQITTVAGTSGGITHDLLVNPQPDAVIGDALFRASQQVRLYANAGTQVQALFRRSSSAGNATFEATLSGYLVDM